MKLLTVFCTLYHLPIKGILSLCGYMHHPDGLETNWPFIIPIDSEKDSELGYPSLLLVLLCVVKLCTPACFSTRMIAIKNDLDRNAFSSNAPFLKSCCVNNSRWDKVFNGGLCLTIMQTTVFLSKTKRVVFQKLQFIQQEHVSLFYLNEFAISLLPTLFTTFFETNLCVIGGKKMEIRTAKVWGFPYMQINRIRILFYLSIRLSDRRST